MSGLAVGLSSAPPAAAQAAAPEQGLVESVKLVREAFQYQRAGRYAEAIPLIRRVLAINERLRGKDHPDVAKILSVLATFLFRAGDYAEAETVCRRALVLGEKGGDPLEIAKGVNNLATILNARGDYAAAEPLYRRALAIHEKVLGPSHPEVATSLDNLGGALADRGDYAAAEPLYRRALAIREKAVPKAPLDVAISLNNLSQVFSARGNYAAAEPFLRRALAIVRTDAREGDQEVVATILGNLAGVLRDRGDYAAAEPLLRRALAIRETRLGPAHPDVALSLANLGLVLAMKGDRDAAEPLYRRALAIDEKVLGREHRSVAIALNNLAVLLQEKGDYRAAEPLLRRSLAIREKALGKEHPDVAGALNNLAALLHDRGDYARAEPLYRRALAISEKALGADHPDVTVGLHNLAMLHYARGDADPEPTFRRGLDIEDRNALRLLETGSVRQKQAFFATLTRTSHYVMSFHAQGRPKSESALNLALRALLRRKGLAAEVDGAGVQMLAARADPQDRAKLVALRDRRGELARLLWAGSARGTSPGQRRALRARLEEEVEALERDLSARHAELRITRKAVTVESVQAALPRGAALVEYGVYRTLDPKAKRNRRWGRQEYIAYVLPGSGPPRFAALGPAAPIEAVIRDYRDAVAHVAPNANELARKLDRLVMEPVRALLGEAREVYIAPDGALSLIPFAALVDEDGRFLIERYRLNLVTSGRDLLRFQEHVAPRSGPIVIGGPDYGNAAAPAAAEAPSAVRSVDLANVTFPPLKGTLAEAKALARLLPRATTLTGRGATETALKSAHAPSILHIATHGFFLADAVGPGSVAPEGRGLGGPGDGAIALPENPMLRAGLAFEGANRRRSGSSDDGILTALEASSLDLWGTQLVVLSACDTGVGQVNNGDGVYGLRRALVVSGSETQLMSLWEVDDEVTRALMLGYYKHLLGGAGRIDALRKVQLRLLARPETAHPYYWAAFIGAGDPTPLRTR